MDTSTQQEAPNQKPDKEAPQPKNDTLFVVDRTATDPVKKRVHDLLLDGGRVKQYRFGENEKVEMPASHAIRFGARDKAFEVYDHSDKRLNVMAGDAKPAEGTAMPVIPEGCCIARFEELTIDSLVVRANTEIGGLKCTKRDGKEALIAFLVDAQAAKAAAAAGDEDGIGDGDADDMNDTELKQMFRDA